MIINFHIIWQFPSPPAGLSANCCKQNNAIVLYLVKVSKITKIYFLLIMLYFWFRYNLFNVVIIWELGWNLSLQLVPINTRKNLLRWFYIAVNYITLLFELFLTDLQTIGHDISSKIYINYGQASSCREYGTSCRNFKRNPPSTFELVVSVKKIIFAFTLMMVWIDLISTLSPFICVGRDYSRLFSGKYASKRSENQIELSPCLTCVRAG